MPREKARKKGKSKGKFRKNSAPTLVLSDADLQFLTEKTNFDAPEITEWFRCVLFSVIPGLFSHSFCSVAVVLSRTTPMGS